MSYDASESLVDLGLMCLIIYNNWFDLSKICFTQHMSVSLLPDKLKKLLTKSTI